MQINLHFCYRGNLFSGNLFFGDTPNPNWVITGGKTTGNGGGVLNNGILTLYGGEITGNVAAIGGGVYNNGGAQGFWMTGGLIDNNTATTNPAIGGAVIFNENAAVQIDAQGTQVTIAQALANMSTYSYVMPVMPNYEEYNPTTAIESVTTVQISTQKILQNGILYIIKNGVRYNTQGQRIQ